MNPDICDNFVHAGSLNWNGGMNINFRRNVSTNKYVDSEKADRFQHAKC